MSGHNPLYNMDSPLKRTLRRLVVEHLPQDMREDDKAMSYSDAARAIQAMEARDKGTLEKLRLAAAERATVEAPSSTAPALSATQAERDSPEPKIAIAHPHGGPGSEDDWFARNEPALIAAALARIAEKAAEAAPEIPIEVPGVGPVDPSMLKRHVSIEDPAGSRATRRPPVQPTPIDPTKIGDTQTGVGRAAG